MAPANRSVPYKKFKAWLKKKGLSHIRTKGSHEQWNKLDNPYPRPIVFRPKDKDIPLLHIKTNLSTMGIEMDVFLYEIKDC